MKLDRMGLAGAKSFSKFSRGQARVTFEGSREVALVEKAGAQSDLSQRGVRRNDLMTSKINAQLTQIFSDCTLIILVEFAGQMNRVDTYGVGDLSRREGLSKSCVEKFSRLFEPARRSFAGNLILAARCGRDYFKQEALDCQGQNFAHLTELVKEFDSKPSKETAMKIGRVVENRRILTHPLLIVALNFNIEGMYSDIMEML